MQLSVFLFHRVSPERDPLWDPIDPKRFEQQLLFLRKRYHFVPLEEYLQNPKPIKVNKPLASIVFDDGYKDFLEYAFPILQKLKLPSSMYIVTNCADQLEPIWTYQLDYLFWKTKKEKLYLDPSGKDKEAIIWKSVEDRLAFVRRYKPQLKKFNNRKREAICNWVKDQFDDVVIPPNLYLNWDEIREINRAGVEIGSHTVSHPMLGNINDVNRLEHELTFSAERIQKELGFFPLTISYPIGSYTPQVKTMAQNVGYQFGLAVEQKKYQTDQYDYFEIPRIELYNEKLLKSYLRSSGIWNVLSKIKNR